MFAARSYRTYDLKSLARLNDYLQVVLDGPNPDSFRENEFEAICHNLHLSRGEKLLDIGCELLTYAAKIYDTKVLGLTLNHPFQIKLNQLIAAAGLQGSAVKFADYRNPVGAKFDKAVCLVPFIGVGRKDATTLFGAIYNLLYPNGLFLTQYISTTRPSASSSNKQQPRLTRYVNSIIHPSLREGFLSFNEVQVITRQIGFEIQLVEDVSAIYFLRLQRWLTYLQTNRDSIISDTSEATFHTWSIDLPILVDGIKSGDIRLNQSLLSKSADSHHFVSLPDSQRCCGFRHEN